MWDKLIFISGQIGKKFNNDGHQISGICKLKCSCVQVNSHPTGREFKTRYT